MTFVYCASSQHSGTFGENALQCFGLIPILRKTSCKSPSRPKNCAMGVTGRIAPKSTHALSSYGIGDQARLWTITRPLSRSFTMRRGHVQGNCACGWYLDFQAANDHSHRAVVFPLGLVPAGASSCQEYRRSEPSPFVADLSWVVIIARQYINHRSRAMPWHYQLGPCVSVI